jgi:hypothetical protein
LIKCLTVVLIVLVAGCATTKPANPSAASPPKPAPVQPLNLRGPGGTVGVGVSL